MGMAEYIELDLFLKNVKRNAPYIYHMVAPIALITPAADVAPVRRGRWRYFHKQNIAVCSECSFERNLDVNFGRAVSCPNCAAIMEETNA